jgi:2-isopropylmalate synthase
MSTDRDSAPKTPGLARARRGGRALDRFATREEFEKALARIGYADLSAYDAQRAWDAYGDVAATKQHITIPDLHALVDDRLRALAEQYQLLRMETRTRTGEPAWARVELLERGVEIPVDAEGYGDGPIDAALSAVLDALQVHATLVAFSVEALSTGTDALCEAHVTVEVGQRHHHAEGVAASLTEAGVRAFLHALSAARRAGRAEPA